MKIIRYDWESCYMNKILCRSVLSYENVFLVGNFDRLSVKNNSNISKNIDQTKILSLNFVFSNENKGYLIISINKDKNPLKKTVNKSIGVKTLIGSKLELENIVYIVFVYLFNYYHKKNIVFKQKLSKKVFNLKIKEINSILKVGHSYNVLDLDPSLELYFSGEKNTKNLQNYYID